MESPITLVFACASFAACVLLAGCSPEPGVQSEAGVPFHAFTFDRNFAQYGLAVLTSIRG